MVLDAVVDGAMVNVRVGRDGRLQYLQQKPIVVELKAQGRP